MSAGLGHLCTVYIYVFLSNKQNYYMFVIGTARYDGDLLGDRYALTKIEDYPPESRTVSSVKGRGSAYPW